MDVERLARYIPAYPRPDDPELVYKLAHLEEFRQLTYEPGVAETVEKGELLATQKFAQRLFNGNTAFNRALFWKEPGTGKTCSAGAIIEEYAKFSPPGADGFRKAIVIVKNNALVEVFRREIAEVCAPGTYVKSGDEDYFKGVAYTDAAIADRVRKAVAKVYDIKTFNDIVKIVKSTSPEVIRNLYSHTPIIIDEAHAIHQNTNLMAPGETREKIEGMYDAMHTFLHSLEGGYQILMTGTPMWDSASEFADLMNLILPSDEQLPTGNAFMKRYFDAELNLKPQGEKELKERCRGKISFLRAAESTIGRQEMGVHLGSQMIVFPTVMSDFQAKYVREATESDKNRIYSISLDASDMVLPVFDAQGKVVGGAYTKAEEHVNFKKHQITSKFLKNELQKNLARYSVKFAATLQIVKDNPHRCHFIHVKRVKGVGGAIFLGILFALNGFVRILRPEEITQSSTERRFCVMTTDPSTTSTTHEIAGVCAAASKPENAKGDLLQVVIGSDKVILGITLKNFTTVIQVRSHWGPSAIDQTMFRALRQGSHDAVEPDSVFRIYRMTSIFPPKKGQATYDPGEGNVYPPGALIPNEPEENVNLILLRIVEEKDKPMTQIRRRVAKPIAVDSVANYHRNVLPTDVTGSRQCDYQDCNFEIDGVPYDESDEVWRYPIRPEEVDHSTYVLFYAGPKIAEIRDHILQALRKNYKIHVDEVVADLQIIDQEVDLVYEAVRGLVNSRATVTNALGIPCYVKESANYVFLDSSISQTSGVYESIYTSQVYVTHRQSLGSMVDAFTSSSSVVKEKILAFCHGDQKTRLDILKTLSSEVLAEMFEATYVNGFGPNGKAAVATLEAYLKAYIFKLPDRTFHLILNRRSAKTSYGVGSNKIKADGKLRSYDPQRGWYSPPLAEQDEIALKIQETKSKSIEELYETSPYGFVGWISAVDGKFRIYKPKAEGGGKKATGQEAATMKIPLLQELVVVLYGDNLPVSATEKRDAASLRDVLEKMNVEVPPEASETYLRGLMNVYSTRSKATHIDWIRTKLDAEGLILRS